MNDLVERLSKEQEVKAGTRGDDPRQQFANAIKRNYVHVLFAKTGTELGVELDPKYSDLSKANVENKTGEIKVGGTLVLNYNRVRCHATINLETLTGTGSLEFIEEVTPAQLSKEREARNKN